MATALLSARHMPHEPIPKAIRLTSWICFVTSSKVYIFLHVLSIISSCFLRVLHKQKGRVVIFNHSSFLFVKYPPRQLTLLENYDILIDRGLFYGAFSWRSIRDASFYFPTNSMTLFHIRLETWICLSSPGFEPVTQMVPVLFGFCSHREICHAFTMTLRETRKNCPAPARWISSAAHRIRLISYFNRIGCTWLSVT